MQTLAAPTITSPPPAAPTRAAPGPATPSSTPALAAYEALAPYYDVYTAGYAHERWLSEIEALALGAGLRGRRVLDVACGTGKSFEPLLARGYRVSACDLSPAMVAIAQAKAGPRASVFVADMRALPDVGRFDLITCLDDSVNYLLIEPDVVAAFRSMRRLLARDGVLVFDVNTLATYRTVFAQAFEHEVGAVRFRWSGETPSHLREGGLATARVAVEHADGGRPADAPGRHVQRHYPRAVIERALAVAGLECTAVLGQLRGARLEPHADEAVHTKFVYAATAPGSTPRLAAGGSARARRVRPTPPASTSLRKHEPQEGR